MTTITRLFLCVPALLLARKGSGQNLDSLINLQKDPAPAEVTGTFKGTRIINLQSVEKAAPGTLQFLIQHRFGALNGGGYELFGLDQATMRLGLEYGVSKALSVGIGRSTHEKNFDGYAKFIAKRQGTGPGAFPLTIGLFGSAVLRGQRDIPGEKNGRFHRLTYTSQLLLARKFSERFSLQLSPTWVHKNQVDLRTDPNDFFALGAGGRIKVTKRLALTLEYISRFAPANAATPAYARFQNSLSAGFDIETGGHVFQFHLTNSLSMVEKGFVTETAGRWGDGGIHLGFNISRDFTLRRHKKRSSW